MPCNILSLRDNLIRRWSSNESSIIQLGASTIPSAYILPEILPAYGKEHPEAYFIIHQNDSRGVVEGILNGSFDLGMIGMKYDHEDLTCIPFYRDRMVLITPVDPRFLALKEQESPCGSCSRSPSSSGNRAAAAKRARSISWRAWGSQRDQLKVTARVNDQESIKNLVAGGLGISIISERAALNFVQEKRVLLFDLPDQGLPAVLFYFVMKRELGPQRAHQDLYRTREKILRAG